MKKTIIPTATLMAACLVAGCSAQPIEPPDAYRGTGEIVDYHANGKVKRVARYEAGELASQVSYYASGTEASNELFESGEIQSATYYFENGEVKTEVTAR